MVGCPSGGTETIALKIDCKSGSDQAVEKKIKDGFQKLQIGSEIKITYKQGNVFLKGFLHGKEDIDKFNRFVIALSQVKCIKVITAHIDYPTDKSEKCFPRCQCCGKCTDCPCEDCDGDDKGNSNTRPLSKPTGSDESSSNSDGISSS